MIPASEKQELQEIIHREFENVGRRTTHRELMDSVLEVVGHEPHLAAALIRKGLSGHVTSYFSKHREDGLPFAPVVNDSREHVDLELAGFAELEFVARGCIARGEAEFAQARKVAALARATFGRTIVVAGVDLSEAAA